MEKLPDLLLTCVGGGALTEFEINLINKLIPKRVTHLNGVPDDILNTLYNSAYCLAYPSSYEGFGIPVLEAMRAGCPVVAFNGSSIPEVAGDAALLIDELNVDALREAILRLQSEDFRNFLRTKGFNQAARFSWEDTFDKTKEIYETIKS